jgi:hypothetical protein
MTRLAEQYSEKVASYDKMAADEAASHEQRVLFAKKANWFRVLARLAAQKEEMARSQELARARDPSLLFAGSERTAMHFWRAPLVALAALACLAAIGLWT